MQNILFLVSGTSIGSLPWWGLLIIILGLGIIATAIPWRKFSKRKRPLTEKEKKLEEERKAFWKKFFKALTPDIFKKSTGKEKPKIPEEEYAERYFGLYNFFGAKTAIRWAILVYPKEEKDPCPLCAPFEHKVLSLDRNDPERMTMAEAVAKGYHHIGCHHIDENYFPGATEIPKLQYSTQEKEKAYNLRKQQYKLEARLRTALYNQKNTLSRNKADLKKLSQAVKLADLKLDQFVTRHHLTRNKLREDPMQTDAIKWS